MRNFAKTAIALSIAAITIAAAAAPSYAQTRSSGSRYEQQNQGSTWVPDSVPRDRGASNG
jgi:hypothetical protein